MALDHGQTYFVYVTDSIYLVIIIDLLLLLLHFILLLHFFMLNVYSVKRNNALCVQKNLHV